MKFKQVTKKGDPIPYAPEEALPHAVQAGAKKQSDNEKIYWVLLPSIVKTSFSSHLNPNDKSYEARATGTVDAGWTDVATDLFYKAKPHNFDIVYKSGKDELGLPDLIVVSMTLTPVDNNPRTLMSFPSIDTSLDAPVIKKITPPKPEVVSVK